MTGSDEVNLSIGAQRVVSLRIFSKDEMEELVPTKFQLSQNYPDPFKEQTTIKYCLPEKVKIRLELFDSEKRKIKTLVDEVEAAGTYKVELEGKGLKKGVYFYRLTAGSFVQTKMTSLIK